MIKPTRNFTVRRASIDDVPTLVENMLSKGLESFENLGMNPVLSIALDFLLDDSYLVYGPNGELFIAYGIREDGEFWVQMTHNVKKHPIAFLRAGKLMLEQLTHPMLWSHIDITNKPLLDLARYLGFKVLRVFPNGPFNTYSVEIVRLWHFH
jgi:hypothetical protein